MGSASIDIFLWAGAVVQVVLFVLFGRWVNQRKDYYVFRRWRASIFIGSLLPVIFAVVPIVAMVLNYQPAHWQWQVLLVFLLKAGTLIMLFTCISMPGAFLMAVVFYIKLMYSIDEVLDAFDWLDFIWPNPRVAAPRPLVR